MYAGTSANSIDVYRVDEGILTLIDNHKCNELKNIKSVLENGLILQIKYTDENSEASIINIPVLVKNS